MADVGVLNLQIQADASQASTSLSALADALTRVKNAVGKGLSFGKLPTQLGKMREALGGDWSGAETFNTSMSKIKEGIQQLSSFGAAGKLESVAGALNTIAKAVEKYRKATEGLGGNSTADVQNSVKQATSGVTGRIALNLQQFGSSKDSNDKKPDFESISKLNNLLDVMRESTKAANEGTEAMDRFAESVRKIKGPNAYDGGFAIFPNGDEGGLAAKFDRKTDQFVGLPFKEMTERQQKALDETNELFRNSSEEVQNYIRTTADRILAAMGEVERSFFDSTIAIRGYEDAFKGVAAVSEKLGNENGASNGMKAVEQAAKSATEATKKHASATQEAAKKAKDTVKTISDATKKTGDGSNDKAVTDIDNVKNAAEKIDSGTISNIQALGNALKELKGISGIGKQLSEAVAGLNAILKFDGGHKGTSGTIERIGTALKHFGEKTIDFKVPNFSNLIKLAEALQKGFFASVEIENIAKALEHLKNASDGFVMPNLSGLTNLSSALAGTGVADAKAVAGVQKVGEAVDETAGKMEQLPQETQVAMDTVANNAQGASSSVAEAIDNALPDTMRWRVGENMTPVASEAKSAVSDVKASIEEASQSTQVSTKQISDSIDETAGKMVEVKSKTEEFKSAVADTSNTVSSGMGNIAASARDNAASMIQDLETLREAFADWKKYSQDDKTVLGNIYGNRNPVAKDIFSQLSDLKGDQFDAFLAGINKVLDGTDDAATKIKALQELIANPTGTAATDQMAESMQTLQQQTDAVVAPVQEVTEGVKEETNAMQTVAPVTEQAAHGTNDLTQGNRELRSSMNNVSAGNAYSGIQSSIDSMVNGMSSAQAAYISSSSAIKEQIAELAQKENDMRNALVGDIQMGLNDANVINQRAAAIRMLQTEQAKLYAQLYEMENAQKRSTRAIVALSGAFKTLKYGMSKLPFVRLIKQMMRMAKMRALRYMIRELAKGFREGVENVYHYSEAIGGSFHNSMDSAATALNQMKNSIGAAVAPAIQALIPLFNTLVGWITTAANYLNQFFSLLSGKSTWTRALPVATKAFDEQKKAAKGASDSVKDMLADFDELNIIQQNGSGGGSGGSESDTNYAEMFEEVNEYDGKIKDMVQWIEDHMETVKDIAIAIGVAILGWKISKAFDGVLGSLGSIIAGGAMIAIGLQVAYEGAYAYGESGELTTESLLAMAGGALTSTMGGALIGFKIGGPWGALIGGAAGLTLSLYTIIKGIAKGKAEFEDRSRWGDIVTTAEEKQKALDEMFSFATTINVEVINANVETTLAARTKMLTQSALLASNIAAIKADINIGVNPEQDLTTAYTNAMALKNDVQKYLDKTENSLALSIQNVTFKDANGVDISENLLENLKVANTALRSVFEDLGRELAEAYYEGQRTGFKNGEMENMLALMESQQRIIEGGTRQSLQLQAQHARVDILDINWGDMTKEDAGVWAKMLEERFAEYKSTYADPLKKQLETERQGYYDLAGMSKAALVEYENHNAEFFGLSNEEYEERKQSLKDAAEKYENIASNYTDEYINSEVNRLLGLDNLYKEVQQRWAAAFNKNYADIRDDYSGYLTSRDDEGYSWYQYYSSINNYSTDTVQDAVDTLRQLLTDAFPTEIQNMIAQLRDSNQYNVVSFASNAGLAEIYKDLENQWTQQYGTDAAQVMLDEFLRTITKEDAAWMNEILAHVYGLPSPASQKLSSGIMSPFVTGTTGAGWEENNADDRTANATETMQQDITTQNERIDQMNRLLTTMITIMRSGLNVNIAPTSTGGRMVNGMLDAFTRVTGNN